MNLRRISIICLVSVSLFCSVLPAHATSEEEQAFLSMYFNPEELEISTRRAISLINAPAIATVITEREIRNMGARTLSDVLKLVPGMGISITDQGFFRLEVRGTVTGQSEKVLIMIDGHALNKNHSGSAFPFFLDHLGVDNIKKIEIVRGPGSALYGSNAFVAVINIITKNAVDMEGANLSVSGGSFDTRKYNLLAGKTFKNGLKISGSIDYMKTDGPDLRITRDRLSGSPFTAAPGRADTRFKGTGIYFEISYKNVTYRSQYLANDRGAYIGLGFALTDFNSVKSDNFWQELSYSHSFSEKFSSKIKLYYDYFNQDWLVKVFPDGFAGSFPNGMIGGPKAKDRTIGGEIQLDYHMSDTNHLLAGIDYEELKQYDVKAISNFNPNTGAFLGPVQDISSFGNWNRNAKRNIFAAYLQDEWKIKDNVSLTAGVRYDHYSDFGDTTNPRVGIVWRFLENADLKLLYGQAFRAPTFTELYTVNNPTLIGNPALAPEKIKTYEVSIGYTYSERFRIDLNYFHNDMDDLIVRDLSTSPATYANLGRAESKGIEAVLSGKYSHDNYWKIAYSWQDPRDSYTGERIAFVPSNRASASLNYGFSKYLVSHVDVLWTGPRPRPSGDTRDEVASYTTVDLTMTLRNIYKTLEIQAAIHNLLNEKYEDPDLSGASRYIPNDFPREGISALLRVSYKF
ncbi:MAG: TonB-dependent receptor [Nitrospirae bacterium]|nr:MAG: TonB-dependent receptor [Nitrospirota bacterium]